MMFGEGTTGRGLPHVVLVSISRHDALLPASGEPLRFLVSIHEEGTGLSWQRNVRVSAKKERRFLQAVSSLHEWSVGRGSTAAAARRAAQRFGRDLYDTFIGEPGARFLADVSPTAMLLAVDETILNLPWELIASPATEWGVGFPFGRVVTTRVQPRARRDALAADPTVRILVVANDTSSLPATEAEVVAIESVAGRHGDVTVTVDVLRDTSRRCFVETVDGEDYDVVHFAGHGRFDVASPGVSELRFSDGPLRPSDVLGLPWAMPPYIVFNSACESARAAAGRRLVSRAGDANGLAAAYMVAGAEAYLGYFWPVIDDSAAVLAEIFYRSLFELRNVGSAVLAARLGVLDRFEAAGDLTAFGAIFFGDAGTAERRDLATAV